MNNISTSRQPMMVKLGNLKKDANPQTTTFSLRETNKANEYAIYEGVESIPTILLERSEANALREALRTVSTAVSTTQIHWGRGIPGFDFRMDDINVLLEQDSLTTRPELPENDYPIKTLEDHYYENKAFLDELQKFLFNKNPNFWSDATIAESNSDSQTELECEVAQILIYGSYTNILDKAQAFIKKNQGDEFFNTLKTIFETYQESYNNVRIAKLKQEVDVAIDIVKNRRSEAFGYDKESFTAKVGRKTVVPLVEYLFFPQPEIIHKYKSFDNQQLKLIVEHHHERYSPDYDLLEQKISCVLNDPFSQDPAVELKDRFNDLVNSRLAKSIQIIFQNPTKTQVFSTGSLKSFQLKEYKSITDPESTNTSSTGCVTCFGFSDPSIEETYYDMLEQNYGMFVTLD
ncbi:MAG: hypothetical protein VW397_04015 [Candidatus Margulisiibacteriota bacterium]